MNRSGNNNGRQHMWTSTKEVRDYDREMRRSNDDREKFNVNVGDWNGNFANNYERRGYYGNERQLPPSNFNNFDNRDRYLDGSQFEGQRYRGGMPLGRDYTTSNTTVSYGVGAPSTQSDWDHYAVRHQDALIGDPIPFADDSLNGDYRTNTRGNRNLRNDQNLRNDRDRNWNMRDRNLSYDNSSAWRNDSARLGRDMNWGNSSNYTRSTDFEGPVAYDPAIDRNYNPLRGNYASGSVIENGNQMYGYGGYPQDRALYDRDMRGQNRSWGAPLWNRNANANPEFWRDIRDSRTPLLPENPWTHNELGREYLDGRRDHMYKHTDDATVYSNRTKKTMINTSSLGSGRYANDDLAYRTTTRSVPSAFNRGDSLANIPTPPPAPKVWTSKTTSRKFVPRAFSKTTDYSSFDPRDSYFETKKPLFAQQKGYPISTTTKTTVVEKILPATTNSSLNTTFAPTRAN